MNIDLFVFQNINQGALKWLWFDTLAIFFAKYFEYFLIFILFIFLFKNFKKYWSMLVFAFLSAIFSRFVITETIRYFFPRLRPFVENSVNLLITHSSEPSFPSGHASFYFAIATIVYFFNKKAGFLFFLASFLISISRVICGIHWPSDILIGAIVGFFSGFLIILFFRKFSLIEKKPKQQ